MSWRIEAAHEQADSIATLLRNAGMEDGARLVEIRRDALNDALAMLAQDTLDAEAAEAEAEAEPLTPEEEALAAATEEARQPARAAPPPLPAPPPVLTAQVAARKWSDERDALVRERWPAGATPEELRAELNALPGAIIETDKAVIQRAVKLGVRRGAAYLAAAREEAMAQARAARGAPGAAPPTTAPPADIPAEDLAEARAMLRTGSAGAKALSEYFDWPLEQAQEIAETLRAEIAAEAKAA